jgi:Flp pilus assembly protein TadG
MLTLVVSLVALFVLSAFVIDMGHAYVTDRKAQAAADASALGAALLLPDRARASAAAADLAEKNFSIGTVEVAFRNTDAVDDTVSTHATATVDTFFARIIGLVSIDVGATAEARMGSYTGYANTLAPWVTDKASLTFGSEVTFKVRPGDQASSGNFGSVRLPLKGKTCATGSGTNDYRAVIANVDGACLVKMGDTLSTEPGNMGAVTGHALDDRGTVSGFDPYSILAVRDDGEYQLTIMEHANLVVIPIVESFGGGSSTLTVSGFAWFIITQYDKDTVRGMFVRSGLPSGAVCPTASDANAGCPIGAYDADGFRVIQLVG